jgi:hypothetical protein
MESLMELDPRTGTLALVKDDSPWSPGLQLAIEAGGARLLVRMHSVYHAARAIGCSGARLLVRLLATGIFFKFGCQLQVAGEVTLHSLDARRIMQWCLYASLLMRFLSLSISFSLSRFNQVVQSTPLSLVKAAIDTFAYYWAMQVQVKYKV